MAVDFVRNRVFSAYRDASTSNVPTSYSSASTSKVMTGCGGVGFSHVKIFNSTSARIAVCNTDADAAVPSSSNSANTSQIYIPANSTEFKDGMHIYDTFYIRSDSGAAITSGVISVEVW